MRRSGRHISCQPPKATLSILLLSWSIIALRIVMLYAHAMIRSFRHKGIEAYFRTGKTAGIQAKHAARLRLQLARLDVSTGPHDMGSPGWKLHPSPDTPQPPLMQAVMAAIGEDRELTREIA